MALLVILTPANPRLKGVLGSPGARQNHTRILHLDFVLLRLTDMTGNDFQQDGVVYHLINEKYVCYAHQEESISCQYPVSRRCGLKVMGYRSINYTHLSAHSNYYQADCLNHGGSVPFLILGAFAALFST